MATLAEGSVASGALVDVFAVAEGITGETRWAVAVMRARNIGANGSLATQARGSMAAVALVDIEAASSDVARVESESLVAHAGRLRSIVHLAVRVGTASYSVAGRSTASVRVANVTIVTYA